MKPEESTVPCRNPENEMSMIQIIQILSVAGMFLDSSSASFNITYGLTSGKIREKIFPLLRVVSINAPAVSHILTLPKLMI